MRDPRKRSASPVVSRIVGMSHHLESERTVGRAGRQAQSRTGCRSLVGLRKRSATQACARTHLWTTLRCRRREEAPEMRRRILLTVVTVLGTMCALSPTPAQARTAKASFEWFVEENVARASNGDQVTVSGEGTFDAGTKSATGDATFEHRTGAGTLVGSGTIEFERLVAFQFYGCGNVFGTPLPDDYCGGRVIFAVHLVGHLASDP